ncbi:MAG: CRISPR-associated endonuclease Cas2 [Betaproteobacteria bacterium RIFCSPLOWO2_12_FULL_65_14]|nr:MAG: CRISPR-associated endonuclease Cas2 [Betaproteobacteria bacterium RIFCSPLOWO2_12_FULL_65_14]
MKNDEHLYVVTYDVGDPKRWRRVFKLMNGYGEWLQLSVFQCRLSRQRHAELVATLDGIIHHKDDHVILVDLGLAENVDPRVVSLGKVFAPIEREPVIV